MLVRGFHPKPTTNKDGKSSTEYIPHTWNVVMGECGIPSVFDIMLCATPPLGSRHPPIEYKWPLLLETTTLRVIAPPSLPLLSSHTFND